MSFPGLHELQATAIPLRAMVWRIETPSTNAFIASMRATSTLCRFGQSHFNQRFLKPGILWVLHTDFDVVDTDNAPRMQRVLALAFTSPDTCEPFKVLYVCAKQKSPRGVGKFLLQRIAQHAAALGLRALTLTTSEPKLEEFYSRELNMRCKYHECTLLLSKVLRVRVPLGVSVPVVEF